MLPDPDAPLVLVFQAVFRRVGAGLAWIVGLPLFPSGIRADCSTSSGG